MSKIPLPQPISTPHVHDTPRKPTNLQVACAHQYPHTPWWKMWDHTMVWAQIQPAWLVPSASVARCFSSRMQVLHEQPGPFWVSWHHVVCFGNAQWWWPSPPTGPLSLAPQWSPPGNKGIPQAQGGAQSFGEACSWTHLWYGVFHYLLFFTYLIYLQGNALGLFHWWNNYDIACSRYYGAKLSSFAWIYQGQHIPPS